VPGEGNSVRLHAFARGRVQGVGYRDFVERHASSLGLTGYVRNLSDGRSVEVFAEGPRERLERLVESLRQGPGGAYVHEVEQRWGEATGHFEGFNTAY
jgi:acylphosphatase